MEKRGVGVLFFFIAAILFSDKYIAAAIYLSGDSSWDSILFAAGLEYVGIPLLLLSIISFIVGVAYLAWAEIPKKK